MKTKKDFKYTTILTSEVRASRIDGENTKLQESIASSMSKLGNSAPYLCGKKQADLFGTAFEIALVNKFNENGEGINSEGAINMVDSFVHKQMNLEHDRTSIVGHILGAGFCERTFGKPLYYYDVKDSDEIFSIVLSGVIYKLASAEFTKLLSGIVDADENKKVFASWEIGYNEYYVAVGNSRELKECEIVTDDAKVKEYSKYLKTSGGSGKLGDGRYVQRLIVGEILALGGGFTTDPAAEVEPISVYDPVKMLSSETYVGAYSKKMKKSEENISQAQKENVIDNVNDNLVIKSKGETMDETTIKKMIEEAFASKQKESEKQEAIASVSDKLIAAIKESNSVYQSEKEAIAKQKDEAEAKLAEQIKKVDELAGSVKSVEDQLSTANAELEKIREEKVKMEAQAAFDSRIDQVKGIYELDDKLSAIVAKRVGTVDSDESFASLLEEFSVTLAHLNKEAVAKAKAELESKASKTDEADPIVEGGKESTASVVNTSESSAQEESLQDKFSKAFSEGSVIIK